VHRELAPYAAHGNTEIGGSDIILKAEAAQAVSMVLYELTTNAAKCGALSTLDGTAPRPVPDRGTMDPKLPHALNDRTCRDEPTVDRTLTCALMKALAPASMPCRALAS
jgi:hypothetical protein